MQWKIVLARATAYILGRFQNDSRPDFYLFRCRFRNFSIVALDFGIVNTVFALFTRIIRAGKR